MFPLITMKSREARRTSAGISFAAVAVLGLVCVGSAAAWTALRSDLVAERTRRATLGAAVQRLLDGHVAAVRNAAGDAALVSPNRAEIVRGLSEARARLASENAPERLILTKDGAPLVEAAAPRPLRDIAPPSAGEASEGARVLVREGRSYILATSTLSRPELRVVAMSEIDEARLAMLARAAGTRDLRVETSTPVQDAAATLSLGGPGAEVDAGPWLAWTPGGSVGSALLDTLPLVAILAALFGVGVMSNMRRVDADLAAEDERARHHAGHDPLTDLPNRAHFALLAEKAATGARATGGACAVLCIDLRRFKEMNDNYGHEFGDALLREMRDRIARFRGPQDVVSRIAGDVFAVLRVGEGRGACERLARALGEAAAAPFSHGGVVVTPTVTIGIAFAGDVEGPGELLRCADIALDHAKREQLAVATFDQGMMERLKARKQLEDDLRAALANDALDLVYQPVMSADGRSVVGAEALARWRHPTLGPIAPLDFVPLAEERGLIDKLGEWALRRACREAAEWPPELFVAVNVSAIQFRRSEFCPVVGRVLDETGFDPQRLELELTESAVIADEITAEQTIMELRARGVRMALDDFGIGYSSLIYLRRFAFDKIKIDRSFLESMESTGESATIVHSIVHLGRSLGLTVTAEGIETVEQHRFLQAVGCHELQGFLFSRPVSLGDFRKMIGLGEAPVALSA